MSLEKNENKTKIMKFGKKNWNSTIKIGDFEVEIVGNFKYLGVTVEIIEIGKRK